jgi:hypothetical protein
MSNVYLNGNGQNYSGTGDTHTWVYVYGNNDDVTLTGGAENVVKVYGGAAGNDDNVTLTGETQDYVALHADFESAALNNSASSFIRATDDNIGFYGDSSAYITGESAISLISRP